MNFIDLTNTGTTEETTTNPSPENEVKETEFDLVRASWITMTSLLIFIFGMLGNVTTVYIYTRSRELRHKKVFELILAAFDIYALCVLLPIFSFDLYTNEGLSLYFSLAISLCAHSYHITILCCTICRYIAIYRPFSFNIFFAKWRMRFVYIIMAATVYFCARSLVLRAVLKVKPFGLYLVDIFVLTFTSFVLIAVLFILIIAKIMKQNKVGPQAAVQDGGTRKKHLIAVKTFGAVSLYFLISYFSAFMAANGVIPLAALYLYFLNHICNPVIYLFLNREFRGKVQEIFTQAQ